jgi:hypothetical protein
VRRGQIDTKLATDIWEVHLEASLDPTEPLIATAYDAVYIALAIQLDVQLVTAERHSTVGSRSSGKERSRSQSKYSAPESGVQGRRMR